MITYSSEVTIARPPETVFPYLIEHEKQALWSDVEMRPLTAGPFVQGSRMELTLPIGPFKTSIQLEYSSVVPDQLVAWRTVSPSPIQWDGEYRLERSGDGGTRLSQSGRVRLRGLWRLLEPIAGGEIRQGEIKELERLRSVIEQASAAVIDSGPPPVMPVE
jgi:polyketide cyclase/dehydrase/lipid transport protein